MVKKHSLNRLLKYFLKSGLDNLNSLLRGFWFDEENIREAHFISKFPVEGSDLGWQSFGVVIEDESVPLNQAFQFSRISGWTDSGMDASQREPIT